MLHAAVKANDMPMIRGLLADNCDPNSLGDQRLPPLFLCVSAEATDALLGAGANIGYQLGNRFDYPGTALHIAVAYERVEVSTAPLWLPPWPPPIAPPYSGLGMGAGGGPIDNGGDRCGRQKLSRYLLLSQMWHLYSSSVAPL